MILGVVRGMIGEDIVFSPDTVTDGKSVFYDIFQPTIFILLSIGFIVVYVILSLRMSKYFDRSLKDEGYRIKTIFMVFTMSYLTRAIVSLVLPRVDESFLVGNLI